MHIQTAIRYTSQYRRNGKSCYIRAADRHDETFETPVGTLHFVCRKCHYSHGGQSKWWRAYLRYANGRAVPSSVLLTLR